MMDRQELKVRGSADVTYLGRSIDQMIWEFMEEKGIPGLTLAIVQAPYIPRVVGYGVSDKEQKRLASAITVWPAGPISQAFTAVAVMQLYEDGKLDIYERVSKYVKDLPEDWEEITIIQLMGHSAGLPDYRDSDGYSAHEDYTFTQLVSMAAKSSVTMAAGTGVKQSATNFLVLTEVIERVSAMSYHDFVTERQISFIGLKHTGFSEDLGKLNQENIGETEFVHQRFKSDSYYVNPSEVATGYDSELKKVRAVRSSALKGFGDIWASAEDISFWDICLAGAILISKLENRKLLYGAVTLKDGSLIPANAGWQFYHHTGLMDIKGSIPGFSVFLSRFTDPSELVCVTLMANREGVDFANLGRQIAAAFGDALATGSDDRQLCLYECAFDVQGTVERLEAELKFRNIPVFAKFDHGKNAAEAGLDMKPGQVVVFGSPEVGTKLMVENPSIAIDLPLKIAVWEDAAGSTWLAFNKMDRIASKYHMEENPVLKNMQKLLENLAQKVSNVY